MQKGDNFWELYRMYWTLKSGSFWTQGSWDASRGASLVGWLQRRVVRGKWNGWSQLITAGLSTASHPQLDQTIRHAAPR